MAKKSKSKNRSKKRYTRKTHSTTRKLPSRRLRLSKSIRRETPFQPQISSQRRASGLKVTAKTSQAPKAFKTRKLVTKTLTPTEKKHRLVCAKRATRKEVMHAIKKAGHSGQRKPTFNKERNIKCN